MRLFDVDQPFGDVVSVPRPDSLQDVSISPISHVASMLDPWGQPKLVYETFSRIDGTSVRFQGASAEEG